MRQGAPCITYHQDFSSEGSSEQVIEVNSPRGKALGLLGITAGHQVTMYYCSVVSILPNYLNRSIVCKMCEIILSSGLERPQGYMGSLGTAHLEGQMWNHTSQGPSVESAKETKRHGQDVRKHEMVSFSQDLERSWGHVMEP